MPTVRSRVATGTPLSDYSLVEKLAFLSGWSPTKNRGRWRSWAEYLADYARLRPEMRVSFRSGSRASLGPMFGDYALAFRARHGAAALERADFVTIRSIALGDRG